MLQKTQKIYFIKCCNLPNYVNYDIIKSGYFCFIKNNNYGEYMELSLQSKYKRREILAKRREIIEKEKTTY